MKFEPSETELETYKSWIAEHRETCYHINYKLAQKLGHPTAAIGGAVTFEFTPTGIGISFHVKCVCGAKKDCTDYDCW